MATIIGALRPQATAGEIELLNRLRELPDSYIVWPELAVYDRHPDFVIVVPNRGVAVLEVKDWVEITAANPDTFTVQTRAGSQRRETNPVVAVREKAFAIQQKLCEETRLCHADGPFYGRLRLPYAFAVVFTHLTDLFLRQFQAILDNRLNLITRDQLAQQSAVDLLDRLDWRFHADLTPADVDLIRATLYPELRVMVGEREAGVMDLIQEQAAKEGLHERPNPIATATEATPADDLPEHGRRLAVNPLIRLVRGVAGSGKTLVLIKRARYLAELNPDWRVLVLSYNRGLAHNLRTHFHGQEDRVTVTNFHQLCRELLEELDDWGGGPVNDRLGAVNHLLREMSVPDRLDAKFLTEEIGWIKESNLGDERSYLTATRVGRGRPLGLEDRQAAFEVFRHYQEDLLWRRRYDWDDAPLMLTNAIARRRLAGSRYEAILVDEAQDFAPTWFSLLRHLLNPETAVMFMAADGAQRIYRHHSWRSLGLHVVGRTRVLPHPYRMTYEIACAAAELARGHPAFVEALVGEGEFLPDSALVPDRMRHGRYPELRLFPTPQRQLAWLHNRLEELGRRGYATGDIALFFRKTVGVEEAADFLRRHHWPVRTLKTDSPVADEGITVGTMHAAKGLEFRVVFVPELQTLFTADVASPDEQRAADLADMRLLYVALTRARDLVYLTHRGRLPDQLAPLAGYLDRQAVS